MKTLVIIPAYNEGECIRDVVNNLVEINNDVDVLVVNDGSKDNTYEQAKQTSARVASLPINLGIGGAVQTGYLYAYQNGYDIAIQYDGDGQHNASYMQQMIEILEQNEADMVIGSRFVEKTGYKQTFARMAGIIIIRTIIKIFTRKNIYDPTSGYRAVNRKIIKKFAEEYPHDYPEPDTNIRLLKQKARIKEISVKMNNRETGKSSITPLRSVYYMIKVSLAMIICVIQKNEKMN